MTLTVELPNDLARHENPAREALEALVLEAVRTESMERADAANMLGMGRLEFLEYLRAHDVATGTYGVEEFLKDMENLNHLYATGELLR